MPTIFDKQCRLRPTQLHAVAERRFRDAEALAATGRNERAQGAQYLCGFVIEILLKAKLIQLYPFARRGHDKPAAEDERQIWDLVWRSHDLERILGHLPQLEAALNKAGGRVGKSLATNLKMICGRWTVYARYSTLSSTIADARTMIGLVGEIKEFLK